MPRPNRACSAIFFGSTGLLALCHPARAVPAFAGQTGQPCTACHVGAFGPELTQFGRMFKITGYTLQGGSGTLAHLPLSAFIQTSFTSTATRNPGPAAPDFASNNNFAVDQISLFLAGHMTNYAGAFIQASYDGVGHGFNLDNTDIRLTADTTLWHNDVQLGLSLNNGPMVQDPYNTTYAWNYPFIASLLANTPVASTVLGGALLGNTLGLTASAWLNQSLYLEAGFYDTQAPGLLSRLGEAYGPGSATGPAPYVRVAYEWNWSDYSAHVGAAFFHGRFNPATDVFSATGAFGHDSYTDEFVDAGLQYLSADGRHSATLNGFATHESRALDGSANLGAASTNRGTLNESRLVSTYYFDRTYGATLAWEKTWGSPDPLLYQQGAATNGSANAKPNSNAFVIEADWVPFGKEGSWRQPLVNLKLGLQYTIYTAFNGAGHDYDGFGRSASDNNTLFLFAWFVF